MTALEAAYLMIILKAQLRFSSCSWAQQSVSEQKGRLFGTWSWKIGILISPCVETSMKCSVVDQAINARSVRHYSGIIQDQEPMEDD